MINKVICLSVFKRHNQPPQKLERKLNSILPSVRMNPTRLGLVISYTSSWPMEYPDGVQSSSVEVLKWDRTRACLRTPCCASGHREMRATCRALTYISNVPTVRCLRSRNCSTDSQVAFARQWVFVSFRRISTALTAHWVRNVTDRFTIQEACTSASLLLS